MKTKRTIFRVLPNGRSPWVLKRGGRRVGGFATQMAAVRFGRDLARAIRRKGGLAQLVVHRRDGRVAFEHTYGRDPKRYVG